MNIKKNTCACFILYKKHTHLKYAEGHVVSKVVLMVFTKKKIMKL